MIIFDILRLSNKDNNKRCIKIRCIIIPIIIVFCIFSLIFCIIADHSTTLYIPTSILFILLLIYWGCNFVDILPELKKRMKKDTKNGKNTHGFHNI